MVKSVVNLIDRNHANAADYGFGYFKETISIIVEQDKKTEEKLKRK